MISQWMTILISKQINLMPARFITRFQAAVLFDLNRFSLSLKLTLVALLLAVSPITSAETQQENSLQVEAISQQPWVFLKSYLAKYKVVSKKKTLGHASRKLSFVDGRWTLTSFAKISKFFLTLRNNETSQFHIKDENLFSDRFYTRTKLTFKKARTMEQNFDWELKTEKGQRNKKAWELKHDDLVYDRVSHLFRLRADLITGQQSYVYPVSYKGRVTEYKYSIEKQEKIKTKMGELATLKLVRLKSNGDRFVVWLCPDMNYFPVKIAQYEKGEPDVTLILESFEYLPDETKETQSEETPSEKTSKEAKAKPIKSEG